MRKLITLVFALAAAGSASAQQVDNIGDVVVSMYGRIIWGTNKSGNGTATISCSALAATQPASACSVSVKRDPNSPPNPQTYPGVSNTPRLNTRFIPGVPYTVSVSVDNNYAPSYSDTGAPGFDMYVSAPPGYVVEQKLAVDQYYTPTEHLNVGLSVIAQTQTVLMTMRLRPAATNLGLRAGMATSLGFDHVLWELSLGYLPNGSPAGALTFDNLVGSTTLAGMFTRQKLYSNTGSTEVVQLMDSGDNNTIRQVSAPQVFVNITGALSTGNIQIDCYHPSQRNPNVDPTTGYYGFSGSPFASYLVQPLGTDDAGIQIDCSTYDVDAVSYAGTFARKLRTTVTRSTSAPTTWTTTSWYDSALSALMKQVKVTNGSTETITAQDSANVVAVTQQRTYGSVALGQEITQLATGSTSQNPTTTTYSYYDTGYEQTLSFGKPQLVKNTSSGAWQAFDYDGDGHVAHTYGPFGSSPTAPTSLPPTGGVTVGQTYSADLYGQNTRPAATTTSINGNARGQSSISYGTDSTFTAVTGHTTIAIITATRTDLPDNTNHPLTTVSKYFSEACGSGTAAATIDRHDDSLRGLPYSVTQPSGAKVAYAYQYGTWNGSTFAPTGNGGYDFVDSASDPTPTVNSYRATRTIVVSGTSDSTAGSAFASPSGMTLPQIDAIYPVPGKSTLSVSIRDRFSRVVHSELWVWAPTATGGASSWNQVSSTDASYNQANELTQRSASNGGTYSAVYSGDRIVSETTEAGITTGYVYDADGRVDTSTIAAAGGIGALATKFTYDGAGNVLTRTVGSGQTETLVYTNTYDDSGRLKTEISPGATGNGATLTTTYSYDPTNSAQTVTGPDGSSTTQTMNWDGSVASISGNGVVNKSYTYTAGVDGIIETDLKVAGSTSRILKQWTDWAGRVTKTSRPGFAGGSATFDTQMSYGTVTGLLLNTTRSGYGNTLYKYDVLGQPLEQGLKVDGTLTQTTADGSVAVPTPASNDRITDADGYFEYYSGAWWLTKTQSIYPTAGSGTPLVATTTRTRLSNFAAPVQAETVATDLTNLTTDTTVSVDRANATVTKTTTVKDASGANVFANSAVEISKNGLAVSTSGFDGLVYTVGYDGLYRKSTSTAPRTGTITTEYKPGSTFVKDIKGAINAAGTIGYIEQYDYDIPNRITKVTNALGNKVSYTERDTKGNVVHQWGDTVTPVEYLYDGFGQRYEMHTYQSGAFSGASTTWPGAGYTYQKTSWNYDEPSGLLANKTDAAGKATVFTYNLRGQVYTRTWARHIARNASYPQVQTTYGYDPNTGELLTVSYNDNNLTTYPGAENTAPVTYTYTRLGQINTVADATSSDARAVTPSDVRSFKYGTRSGGNVLELDAIQLPSYYNSGTNARVLTRQYDSVFRGAGFQLGTAGSPAADLSQTYTFNTLNRFDHLDVAANGYSAATNTFTYSYYPVDPATPGGAKSPLVGGYAVGTNFGVTYSYETNRNLMLSVSSTWGSTTTLTRYDYTYNALGQRATAQQSGTAYADIGTTTYNHNYTDRGEITSSADYLGGTANAGNTSYQLPDRNFYYAYDSAGNRTASSRHGAPTGTPITNPADSYSANTLNQYQSRTNLYAEVAGAVSSSTTSVAVSGGSIGWSAGYGRKGNYWADDAQPGTSPLAIPLSITASGTFGSTNYQYNDSTKTLFFPGTQTFTYDDDGNMIGDGIWAYTYDAENRLIAMQSVAITGFPNKLLNFTYDYLNRRVEKKVGSWNGSTYVTSLWRRYVYDGDNLVAEFNASGGTTGSIQRSYAWGLDVSGSLSATGGVGALLQITDHPTNKSYFPTYDANGNIASLVNASSGTVAVSYEYSPFGELLRRGGATYTGADAAILDNPFAFSTKFTDWETSLVYYGARFYSPSLGSFINRDPIAEAGGLNLYGFCGNDGIDGWDYLGNWSLKSVLKKVWKPLVALAVGIATAGVGLMAYAALTGATFVGGLTAAISSVGLAAGWGTGWAVAAGVGMGFGTAAASTLLNGGSVGAALKAGVVGGIAGGIGAYVGGVAANSLVTKDSDIWTRTTVFTQDVVYGAAKGVTSDTVEAIAYKRSIGNAALDGILSGSLSGMATGIVDTLKANRDYAKALGGQAAAPATAAFDIKPLGAVLGAAAGGALGYTLSGGSSRWASAGALAGGIWGWMNSDVYVADPKFNLDVALSRAANAVNVSASLASIDMTTRPMLLGMTFPFRINIPLGIDLFAKASSDSILPPLSQMAWVGVEGVLKVGPIPLAHNAALSDWVPGARARSYP